MPNQSPEPMRGIAFSSASRLDVFRSRMAQLRSLGSSVLMAASKSYGSIKSWICPGFRSPFELVSRTCIKNTPRPLMSSRLPSYPRVFSSSRTQCSSRDEPNKLTGANRRSASGFRLSVSSLTVSGCCEPQALPAPIAQFGRLCRTMTAKHFFPHLAPVARADEAFMVWRFVRIVKQVYTILQCRRERLDAFERSGITSR